MEQNQETGDVFYLVSIQMTLCTPGNGVAYSLSGEDRTIEQRMKKCWLWTSIYLGVNSNDLVALLAAVGEDALVALDAVGVVIAQHVALTCQRLVALPAAEVPRVPVLVHGLGVLAAENQLENTPQLV